jgi:hypothetical protein
LAAAAAAGVSLGGAVITAAPAAAQPAHSNIWEYQYTDVGTLDGISCVDAGSCVAVGVGEGPVAVINTTASNANDWSNFDSGDLPGSRMHAVSCFSARLTYPGNCETGGGTGDGGPSAAWFDGDVWETANTPEWSSGFTGMSCTVGNVSEPLAQQPAAFQPKAQNQTPYCVGVGDRYNNADAAVTYDGTHFTDTTPDLGAGTLVDVSCSGAFCMAVGGRGTGKVSGSRSEPVFAATSTDGGFNWSDVSPDAFGQFASVWCTNSPRDYCVVVGYDDDANGPSMWVYDNGSWTDHTGVLNSMEDSYYDDTTDQLTGVSCSSIDDCVAVGDWVGSGEDTKIVLATTDGGSSWTDESDTFFGEGSIDYLSRVSCISSGSCWLVGSSDSGTAVAYASNPFGGGGGVGGGTAQATCPPGAVCTTATTPNGANPAIATEDGITATGENGTGTVEAGTYASDPAGPPTFNSTGRYFDVQVSSGNTFSDVVVQDCDLNGGTSLQWWNPAANSGAGGWQPVVGDPGPTYSAGPPACLTFTVDSSSSPTLAQLTGTVFAVAAPGSTATAANGQQEGYWVAGSDGGVYAFGNAGFYGSVPGTIGHAPASPVVGMAATPDAKGYWLAGSDGGAFSFGDAAFHGSVPGAGVHVGNVVGIASTADGAGYWMVGADGGVYAFGDAGFYGSVPGAIGHAPSSPVTGIAPTSDGKGYWLVGSDGGVYAFGDAVFRGSVPGAIGHAPAQPVVGLAATPDGGGYWLVGADGGLFAFGDAGFFGSVPGAGVHVTNVKGMASSSDGQGYWIVGSDGGIYAFGDAGYLGSVPGAGVHVNNVVGMAAT